MTPEDVLIIGAGPAGIAAAIQLQRSGIAFRLLEKEQVGGLLWNANLVENYPGFPAGISGPKLVRLFEKHMHQLGVEVVRDEVLCLTSQHGELLVETRIQAYRPRFVVIATGTQPNPPPMDLPSLARDEIHSGVSALLGLQGCRVAIVGAGDAAFDYALNLARHNEVVLLIRGRRIDCLPLLQSRVEASDRIQMQFETELTRVEWDHALGRLRLTCQRNQESAILLSDHLIFAIGRQPQLGLLSPDLHAQVQDWVIGGRLYFIGDVANGFLRQTGIAVGDGLKAAMQIAAKIKHLGET